MKYETKDSGERVDLGTGYVRDINENKAAFTLIMPKDMPYSEQLLTRWADIMRRGDNKYGTSEDWKEDPYMNTIEVSTHGRIRRKKDGYIYKTWVNKWGYELVSLSNETRKHYQVHRLVAETWIGRSNGLQVNHKDFNRTNNNLENLEYLSAIENNRYSSSAGRYKGNTSNAKITFEIAEDIRKRVHKGEKQKDLASEYSISPQTVSDIMKRRIWDRQKPNSTTRRTRNWERACKEEELERFKDSAMRHMMQWLCGETDEDHAAAVLFNINGAEYVKWKLNGCSK